METREILIIEPTDILVLKATRLMKKEDMRAEERYFKEHCGMNVKIIDARYEIAGVQLDG